MKKICLLLMLLCVILILAGCGEGKGFRCTKLPDDTIEITMYTGKEEDVIIPAELKGRPVTSIGAGAFKDCTEIDKITLPETITTIKENAFKGCTDLFKITFPESVKVIGDGAFQDCDSLSLFDFSEGLTAIGDHAFAGCRQIRSLDLPASLRSIGAHAFSGCEKLEQVALREGLESIGDGAFALSVLPKLTDFCIPASVTFIGENAFGEVKYESDLDNIIFAVEKGSYGEKYVVEAGRPYGYYAAPETENGPIEYSYALLDDGTAKLARYFGSAEEVSVPAELDGYPVTVIGESAFSEFTDIERIMLPEGITGIEDYAFWYCMNLKDIELPQSLQTIGFSTFGCCYDLANITIPENVEYIDYFAFSECSHLRKVTFLGMDTEINFAAFNETTAVTFEVLPGSVPEQYAKAWSDIDYVYIGE